MRTFISTLATVAILANLPASPVQAREGKAATSPFVQDSQQDRAPSPAPKDPPPPPPAARPDPPKDDARQKTSPAGQWVHTEQYGWVWMPYGNHYTYVPPDGGPPSMYVYYPDSGWCWVVAPWLWGWGPRPYFGLAGPYGYAWFGIGLGHWYGFHDRYPYWGWAGRSYWYGRRWNHFGPFSYGPGRGWAPHGGGAPRRGLAPGWRR